MENRQFTNLLYSLTESRRTLLAGVLTVAGSWLGLSSGSAKHSHKHKKKPNKPKPNGFGCLSVDKSCQNADQCCSGICDGKKGKKRCRAHDTGPCDQGTPGLCESAGVTQTRCQNNGNCFCIRTTAGSHVCGTTLAPTECADCRKDADCAALGFPPGTACARLSEGNCAGLCETGMACVAPCGSLAEAS